MTQLTPAQLSEIEHAVANGIEYDAARHRRELLDHIRSMTMTAEAKLLSVEQIAEYAEIAEGWHQRHGGDIARALLAHIRAIHASLDEAGAQLTHEQLAHRNSIDEHGARIKELESQLAANQGVLDELAASLANEKPGNIEHLIACGRIGKEATVIGRGRLEQLHEAEKQLADLKAEAERLRGELAAKVPVDGDSVLWAVIRKDGDPGRIYATEGEARNSARNASPVWEVLAVVPKSQLDAALKGQQEAPKAPADINELAKIAYAGYWRVDPASVLLGDSCHSRLKSAIQAVAARLGQQAGERDAELAQLRARLANSESFGTPPDLMFTAGSLRDAAWAGWYSRCAENGLAQKCRDRAREAASDELAELRKRLEVADVQCRSQHTINHALAASYKIMEHDLATAKEQLAIAKEAGLSIGTLKEAGKEPRLTWDIVEGSPLDKEIENVADLISKNAELEQQLAARDAELERVRRTCDIYRGCIDELEQEYTGTEERAKSYRWSLTRIGFAKLGAQEFATQPATPLPEAKNEHCFTCPTCKSHYFTTIQHKTDTKPQIIKCKGHWNGQFHGDKYTGCTWKGTWEDAKAQRPLPPIPEPEADNAGYLEAIAKSREPIVRLSCNKCDEQHDGITPTQPAALVQGGWRDIEEVGPSDSVLDWETHIGLCAECAKAEDSPEPEAPKAEQERPAFVCPKCGGTEHIVSLGGHDNFGKFFPETVSCGAILESGCGWSGTWAEVAAAKGGEGK